MDYVITLLLLGILIALVLIYIKLNDYWEQIDLIRRHTFDTNTKLMGIELYLNNKDVVKSKR
jgi:hypothetical protein